MATIAQPRTAGQSTIGDIVETIGDVLITREKIRANQPLTGFDGGNTANEFPRHKIGRDSDGDTLVRTQVVPGVENRELLAGVGVLIALGVIAWAVSD